jgi:hypothetical protein
MHRLTALATVSLAALALSACGESEDDDIAGIDVSDGSGQEPVTDTGDSTATQAPGSAEGDAGLFGTAPDEGGPYGELRDGVWGVGPAGEVEFTVTPDGALELVDVRPAEGWDVTEQEVDTDEIEVDLRQGAVELTIEVQLEAGVLEVEIDQDIDPAEAGTFAVGEAATVVLDHDGSGIDLGEVVVAEGWTETGRSVEGDEVELDFRRDGDGFFETWELDADLDDGALVVEVDYEIEGVFGG